MIPAGGWGRREGALMGGGGAVQRTLHPDGRTLKGVANSSWEDVGAPMGGIRFLTSYNQVKKRWMREGQGENEWF